MIVVADTTPLNYLVLLACESILPAMFGHVIIPAAVLRELQAAEAPEEVRQWFAQAPAWLEVRPVNIVEADLRSLDDGEAEAIALAEQLPADLLLIDEKVGRQVARTRGLNIIGTLGLLQRAAQRGLLDLPLILSRLQQTNFRLAPNLVETLLKKEPPE